MISAIIIAGGSGSRAKQAVPKQFLTVNDIPIIAYTMMNVQQVKEIDNIIVVGPAGWESFISTYAEQFNISKLTAVVTGGNTRNASIYNGLSHLHSNGGTGKVCLVDANRPLIPERVFHEVIALADSCDCSLAVEFCYDSMFISNDGKLLDDNIDRTVLFRGSAPECASLKTLLDLYSDKDAVKDTKLSTSGLAIAKGKKVMVAKGNVRCFKITTTDDFELFKAFLKAEPPTNLLLEKR